MAAIDTKRDMLRAVSLFETLSDRELAAVERLADTVDVPAGYVLMRQGASGGEMFVIATGGVVVDRNGSEVATLGPGSVVGEMALLSEGPRTATVTTTEPSTLFVIAHREFHSLMEASAEVRDCVFKAVAHRIREVEEDHAH
jgi:CRP/FNR family transcriptional regulator, cyclic AMP receptor protein